MLCIFETSKHCVSRFLGRRNLQSGKNADGGSSVGRLSARRLCCLCEHPRAQPDLGAEPRQFHVGHFEGSRRRRTQRGMSKLRVRLPNRVQIFANFFLSNLLSRQSWHPSCTTRFALTNPPSPMSLRCDTAEAETESQVDLTKETAAITTAARANPHFWLRPTESLSSIVSFKPVRRIFWPRGSPFARGRVKNGQKQAQN